MLKLNHKKHDITLASFPNYGPGPVEEIPGYEHEYLLDGIRREQAINRYGISVTEKGRIAASCMLFSCGGPTGVSQHSAIVHNDSCVIVIGQFAVSLYLPSLKLEWVAKADPESETCFGIYYSDTQKCFISHGEIVIARISLQGEVIWRASGADIFSEGFSLHYDHVDTVDFNGRAYSFDIETGREITS